MKSSTKVVYLIGFIFLVSSYGVLHGQTHDTGYNENYRITLNQAGEMIQGSGAGFGEAWYDYGNEYIMWFEVGPYDPDRMGYVHLETYIDTPSEQGGRLTGTIWICWSTPEWDISNPGVPPLPDAFQSANDKYKYIEDDQVASYENVNRPPGNSLEHRRIGLLEDYNPGWFGVKVTGNNVRFLRSLKVQCIADLDEVDDDEDPSTGDPDPDENGNCCLESTGHCWYTQRRYCNAPYTWLGDRSCEECGQIETGWDFGDAPSTYGVLRADNGARHYFTNGMYMGNGVNSDTDGKPSATAGLDQYDDGVTFSTPLTIGQISTLNIVVSQPGVINAWLDLNNDGNWYGTAEQVIVDEPVRTGINTINVAVPSTAITGSTYMRFRYSTQTGLSVIGQANDGEVEDYLVQIQSSGNPNPTPPSKYAAQAPSHKYVPMWSQASVPMSANSNYSNGWADTSLYLARPVIADDLKVDNTDPITGLRWWGSFNNWNESELPTTLPRSFHIAVWSDPYQAGVPSTVIWQAEIQDWAWTFCGYTNDPRGIASNDALFEFSTLLSQDEWFYPTPNISPRYWISIAAVYQNTNNTNEWHWMTRPHHHGSAAVKIFDVGSSIPGQTGQWPPSLGAIALQPQAIQMPIGTPWDMSFEILTKTHMADTATSFVTADVDGDGRITLQDLNMLISMWMAENQ